MTQTHDSSQGTIPTPPKVLSGEEVYDMIMGQIEPELTKAQMPLLEEKYKDESPEDRKKRQERYQKAFIEYDKRYSQYQLTMSSSLRVYRHDVMANAEVVANDAQQGSLSDIESQISQM